MSPRERSRDQTIAVALGKRIRQVREDSGMTQEKLAEAAELHSTFISNLERGYRVPTVPTLLKIAAALDVPPAALLDDLPLG